MPEQQAMIKEVLQSEEKGYQRRNQIFVKAVRILEIENIRLNIKDCLLISIKEGSNNYNNNDKR